MVKLAELFLVTLDADYPELAAVLLHGNRQPVDLVYNYHTTVSRGLASQINEVRLVAFVDAFVLLKSQVDDYVFNIRLLLKDVQLIILFYFLDLFPLYSVVLFIDVEVLVVPHLLIDALGHVKARVGRTEGRLDLAVLLNDLLRPVLFLIILS